MKALFKRINLFVRHRIMRLMVILRRITLPGFQGMSIYEVFIFFFRGLFDQKFSLMAAAMSYNFFFSFFPLLILAYSFVPNFQGMDLQGYAAQYFGEFSQFIPEDVLKLINSSVSYSANNWKLSRGLILLNIFLVLYGSTRGIIAMMKAFTKDPENHEIFKQRNIFQLNGMALIIFFILGGLILISLGTFIAGNFTAGYLVSMGVIGHGFRSFAIRSLTYLITLGLIYFSISVCYYLAPATHQRWKFFTPGGLVAGILILLLLIGFGYFISNFTNVNRFYGNIAAIILMMLWFYYLSIVLLIGFELNTAIQMAHVRSRRYTQLPVPDKNAPARLAEDAP